MRELNQQLQFASKKISNQSSRTKKIAEGLVHDESSATLHMETCSRKSQRELRREKD